MQIQSFISADATWMCVCVCMHSRDEENDAYSEIVK